MAGMDELLRQRVPPSGIAYRRVLPRGLRATANSYRIYPTQPGNFSYSGIREIFLPLTGTTGFLDTQHSYLHLKVRNACTYQSSAAPGVQVGFSQAFADQSAHSFINRMRIMAPDGTELERIEKYNKLVAALSDMQYTMDSRCSIGNALSGYGVNNAGMVGTGEAVIPGGAIANSRSYELPLVSGFLSSERYVPIGLVKGSGIRLELLLEDPDVCMVQDAAWLRSISAAPNQMIPLANGYVIEECYYVARIIQFEDDVIATILADIGETRMPISMHSVSYDFNTTSASQATENTHQFSVRNRSAKTLISFPDNSTTTIEVLRQYINGAAVIAPDAWLVAASGVLANFRKLVREVSMRPNFNITQWQYRIGNVQMPVTPVIGNEVFSSNTYAAQTSNRYIQPQFVAEIYKALNRVGDLHSGGSINDESFSNSFGQHVIGTNAAVAAPVQAFQSKFIICMDLESFPNDGSVMESGYDTATNALSIYLSTTSSVGAPIYQMLHFCMHDVIYSISGAGNVFVSK